MVKELRYGLDGDSAEMSITRERSQTGFGPSALPPEPRPSP